MGKKDTTNYQQGDEGDVRFWLPPDHNGKPQVLTAARKRRGDVITAEGERGGVERRALSMPLEFYVARRYITGDQYEAGLRLHRLFRGSILAGRVASMKYGDAGGGYDPDSMALMPRDYLRAMAAVGDPKARRTVWLVCCFDEPAGRDMAWLKRGLDDLGRHFTRPRAK